MFPKIVLGFSIINHPFWGTPIFGNTHIRLTMSFDFAVSVFVDLQYVEWYFVWDHQRMWKTNIMSTALKTDLTDGVHGIDIGGSVF